MSVFSTLFGGFCSVAARDLERRLALLGGEIAAARDRIGTSPGGAGDIAVLERLRARPAELGLTEDEAELELELLEGLMDVAALWSVSRRGGEAYTFRCNSYGDVLRAAFIASRMLTPR